MADRYAQILVPLIHPDQCRFIPRRNTSHNLRRLFHIQDRVQTHFPNAACLILDLEKAFDTLLWPYLFAVPQKIGIGPALTAYTRLLYTGPTSRVRIGKYISQPFVTERGTRQGCQLSPLLFVLAVEPLAIRLRCEGEAWGIPLADTTHCVSLYADDLLIYVSDATQDLTPIWSALGEFARASGLNVNWDKSALYPLSPHLAPFAAQIGTQTLGWSTGAPQYLGVQLYHSPEDLYEGNHRRVLAGIRTAIGFWKTLPLAPIGRVALAKMIMVPRLLYHFANLPVIPPRPFFKGLDTLLTELIWGGKRHRVALHTLYLPTDWVGIGGAII